MLKETEFKVLAAICAAERGVRGVGGVGGACVDAAGQGEGSGEEEAVSCAEQGASEGECAKPACTQRGIADDTGLSLGTVNNTLKSLKRDGLIADACGGVTEAGLAALKPYRVQNAIIMAAGFGSRFVPFTYDTPKGLLKVYGKPMIERQIEQLHEVGVTDVTIVVGYLKECFDYLVDKYGARLVYNPEYATKNNYASLYYARDRLSSTYVLVSDDWMEESVFHTYEYHSWICGVYYEGPTSEWVATTAAHDRITRITIGGADGWGLIGPAYFSSEYSAAFKERLVESYGRPGTEDYYFEHVIRENLGDLPIRLNRQDVANVHEFEDLGELRAFDKSYLEETSNRIMREIAQALSIRQSEIHSIEPFKEGVTNESFVFTAGEERYVFRLPGAGTDKLIDRAAEKQVYGLLEPYAITDEVVYFDAATGNRITRFYDGARVADAADDGDLLLSMRALSGLHALEVQEGPDFDIRAKIAHYAALDEAAGGIRFTDFGEWQARAAELLELRDRWAVPEILCHGDFLAANVLILSDGSSKLIDWEFAGRSDPIMDVAMYGIFAHFCRERLELALELYFQRQPTRDERGRLYLYAALGGFLWTLWATYKQACGQEMGEYPLLMYRYMKDYYRILASEGFLVKH